MIARSGLTSAQNLAGHSSSATTARYDRLWRENVQEAINYRPDAPSPTAAVHLAPHGLVLSSVQDETD